MSATNVRGSGTRPGFVRVNVRSRKEICVNETMEMPASTTLANLRQFLCKTFPYLPAYFKFETEDKVKVDPKLEKRVMVSTLGTTIYLYPFIPKYPKGQEPETVMAQKAAAFNSGSSPMKGGKKALDPIGSPGPGSPGGRASCSQSRVRMCTAAAACSATAKLQSKRQLGFPKLPAKAKFEIRALQ